MKDSGDQSIIPLQRLKIRRQFLAVAAAGKKWASPGLVLQAKPLASGAGGIEGGDFENSEPSIRIGFTASKKVGGSVERNRARRRLKALALEVMAAHARPAYDYVVIARKETLTRPYDLLRQDMATALKRLRLYRPEAGVGPDAGSSGVRQ